MKKAFILSCTLALLGQAAAPDAKWLKLIGGSDFDRAFSVALDREGNAYITGQFYSTNFMFDAHPVTNSGGSTMFVAKYDRFGSNIWIATGGSGQAEGHGVDIDENGSVYVCGDIWGGSPQTFGTTNLIPGGNRDLFLAQIDRNGQFQWVRQGRALSGWIQSAAVTIAGTNVYVTGQSDQGVDFGTAVVTNTSIFLAIYDSDGNVQAARTMARAPNPSGFPSWKMAVQTDGSYCVGLSFSSPTVFFGGTNVNRVGTGADSVLTQWDRNGNLLWFRHLQGGTYASCDGVTLAPNGDLLVVGRTRGTGKFADLSVNDGFLARLTPDGNFVWLNNITTSNAQLDSVAVDLAGNSFICGSLPDGISFLSGIAVTNRSDNYSPFVARFDPAGNLTWELCGTATSSAGYSEAHSVVVDSSGAAFIAGIIGNSMQLGTRSADFHGGGWDILFARLAPDPPPLRIHCCSVDAVTLTWPTNQLGFVLERSAELDGPWTLWAESTIRAGADFISTNRTTNGNAYFRLREQ